jgi:hypothetical protein
MSFATSVKEREKSMTIRRRQRQTTGLRGYFGAGSPNLGWRAPGLAEAAALPVVGGAFALVFDSAGVVAAGKFGGGAGLSLS